jgi:hypothetical protein
MKIPFKDISPIDIAGGKKGEHKVSLDQRAAINSLIAQSPHTIDDFDNPLMHHVAVFKIFLDKIKGDKDFENHKGKFKNERDEKVDDVISKLASLEEKEKQVVLELEERLKNRAKDLAKKV